jgi:hypothetical protein
MKIATALTVIAAGAILAFAVRANPPGLNIHTVGWVVMLTGVAGMLLPGRASGWLRRRIVVRKGLVEPAGPAASGTDDTPYPSYVLHDPAALASAILHDAELAGNAGDEPETAATIPAVPRLAAVRLVNDAAVGPSSTLDDLLADRTAEGQGRPRH